MRSAGVAALVGALTAVPALAHDQAEVRARVTPGSAAPGGQVEVRVTGCSGTDGSAGSGAFVRDAELTTGDGKPNTLSGTTRVREGVSGTYEITVICDGHPHQGVGTVQVTTARPTPTAPVRAGGGGAAPPASAATAAEEAGPGARHAVVGLVLAGVAAVAVALRSARRRHPE